MAKILTSAAALLACALLVSAEEQLRPVVEKDTRPGFLQPDGSQVFFQQCFVTPRLLDSPSRNRITRDGLNVRVGLLCQFVKPHVICALFCGKRP